MDPNIGKASDLLREASTNLNNLTGDSKQTNATTQPTAAINASSEFR